ncbi:MAG: UDP-N-acetylglucosamine diphosphorylase/glucosamine-1-phosphate N-acetyltransferase [Gammaproteobacteria bacterium]|nr:UDP-N-acetylglucosamine diphosphorylase/glucosamine-1-phosphate N-acetyltransferase [Gammaproteobacteria bacterium]
MSMSLSVILLAAGKARRMSGAKTKALYELGGEPLIFHVVRELQKLQVAQIHIVVGFGGEQVQAAILDRFTELDNIHWHRQAEQLGTAHAVSQALPAINPDDRVIVSYTDMPFINEANYRVLLDLQQYDLAFMSAALKDPSGYGRVLRSDAGSILRIIEEADAAVGERKIEEVNIGIMTAQAQTLTKLIKKVKNENKQQEYYLTDCIQIAVDEGLSVGVFALEETWRAAGINTPRQYTEAERLLQRMRVSKLIEKGALVQDANRLDVRGEVRLGRGVVFGVGVVLEGEIELGDNVKMEDYTVIKDVFIAADTVVRSFSHIEGARIGKRCIVGPYARIRPDTRIGDDSRVGNFVEIKRTTAANHTKINHLSYIGDSDIGSKVNIGAGTITCNYDGVDKHRTVIGDGVFVGSDTQIIAPVTIGSNATIGAGSTITHDVPADELTLSRSKQTVVKGWKRPTKKPK